MKWYFNIPLLLILFSIGHSLSAQEIEINPKKYDNPQYYKVTYLKFHSGKSTQAKKIIDQYFVPTSNKAGIPGPVMHLNMITGEWDIMVIWHLKEGLESLNWELSPEDILWEKAFIEITGGKEKGIEISQQWESYIQNSKTHLARTHENL